jgi:glycine cleavage system aminomethyltransferase T
MIFDGVAIGERPGDSVAVALARAGEHPKYGGTLCLTGDCGNCVAVVDNVPYVRTCQTPARPGLVVRRHPAVGSPPLLGSRDPLAAVPQSPMRHRHEHVVIIGDGRSGRQALSEHIGALMLDTARGDEVIGVYPGPTVVVRQAGGVTQIAAEQVIIATGAAELHPVCPGNQLRGIMTAGAAAQLIAAGVDLGVAITVTETPERIEGDDNGRVTAVVTSAGRVECDSVIIDIGLAPRDVLLRMSVDTDDTVTMVGPAAAGYPLPPTPVEGVVCPCSGTTVEDLQGAWDRGFNHVELMKRATLCGTGTCQGAACGPHLQAFVADRSGAPTKPFTGRPMARQLTMGEAAAGAYLDTWRRSPLHGEHLAMGARMDRFGGWWRPWNYGDPVAEYWAVRQGVSIGDVSTLGKFVVSGPDVVEFLERIYPTTIADIRPGRSRYVLVLNERGHLIDDGMVCRETDTRFVLTFTSGGAAGAEMWLRDWAETWGLRVHILDRTQALAAINVTGPLAAELLARLGVEEPPKFLQHQHREVAGVDCHVMRLSFTGEASFELHHSPHQSVELWRALMTAGRDLGVKPHGLQALFGLRLEKGHIIVGQDTELDTTPRRVDMDWAVKMHKPFFLGQEALARTSAAPDRRRLCGFAMDGPAPTEGMPILVNGNVVGHVTSSWASPLLGHTVMLGWQKSGELADEVMIDGRVARRVPTPFYDPEGHRARA